MPHSEMAAGDGQSRPFAARLKSEWLQGDRSRLARLVILALILVAAAMFAASIMTGAADASLGNLCKSETVEHGEKNDCR